MTSTKIRQSEISIKNNLIIVHCIPSQGHTVWYSVHKENTHLENTFSTRRTAWKSSD